MTEKEATPTPLDNYYLFKSCVAGSIYPGIEISVRYILDAINASYTDDPHQSSCTGYAVHQGIIPLETSIAINARNMALASVAENSNITCTCPTTYFNLKHSHKLLSKDPELESRIKTIMKEIDKPYVFTPDVHHVMDVFLARGDDICTKSIYSLSNIKAVTHHGCHYSKFFYEEIKAGNLENPRVLDEILKLFGCEVRDYSEDFLCCGSGLGHNQEYSQKTFDRKIKSIKSVNPDLIVTMCPQCTFTLDYYQGEDDSSDKIPVIYISELLAILLGAEPQDVGLDMHMVPLEPFLKALKANQIRADHIHSQELD